MADEASFQDLGEMGVPVRLQCIQSRGNRRGISHGGRKIRSRVSGFVGDDLVGVGPDIFCGTNRDPAQSHVSIGIVDGFAIVFPLAINSVVIRVPVLFAEIVDVSGNGVVVAGFRAVQRIPVRDSPGAVFPAIPSEDDPAGSKVISVIPDAAPNLFLQIGSLVSFGNLPGAEDPDWFSYLFFPRSKRLPCLCELWGGDKKDGGRRRSSEPRHEFVLRVSQTDSGSTHGEAGEQQDGLHGVRISTGKRAGERFLRRILLQGAGGDMLRGC